METKLYSIQEKSYAEKVLQKGFVIPTVLCESSSLAQHLVNTGLEDPAILEINTEGLPNAFDTAAHDEDELKPYMNDYTDYFTSSPIPASHITEAKLTRTNELGASVYSGMLSMKANAKSLGDMEEIAAGMKKMVNLGICSEEHVDAEIQTAMALAREGRFDELRDEEDMYEEGSFRRPTPEEIANGVSIPGLGEETFIGMEDDFTKSVAAISQPEDGMER